MFRAYSGGKKKNDRVEQDRQDVNKRTGYAIQNSAKHRADKVHHNQHNGAVLQQIGFGESSSDEDGGLKTELDEGEKHDEATVFTLPAKLNQQKQKQAILEAKERMRAANQYGTFPSAPSRIVHVSRPYSDSDDESSVSRFSDRSRDRASGSSKESRRDSYRDHSGDRHRNRRKEHRRRSRSRSSGSSRSSNRHSSSRRRSRSPSKKQSTQKYSFLSDDEFRTHDLLGSRAVYRDVKPDFENHTIGLDRRIISKCHLGVTCIDGLEHQPNFFTKVYGSEIRDKSNLLQDTKFHEQLARIANHVPKETFFGNSNVANGFWKIQQKAHIINGEGDDALDCGRESEDSVVARCAEHKKTFEENKHNIKALIEWLDVEDELYRANTGSFVKSNPRAHLDRKLSILEKAAKHNPRNAQVHLMKIEVLIQLDYNPQDIINEYKKLVFYMPHEIMAWVRYLDFVQYNTNVYKNDLMSLTFRECMDKVKGLVNETMVSHARHVQNKAQMQMFQFLIFVRYVKWKLSCGYVSDAIAQIQATFEYNFGSKTRSTVKERLDNLHELWETRLPRIGDRGAMGAAKTLGVYRTMDHKAVMDEEKADYDIYLYEVCKAKGEDLAGTSHIGEAWVKFERKMRELETRVKRTQMKESEVYLVDYQEHMDDLDSMSLTEPVEYESLKPYCLPDGCEYDIVQPLLEVLGVVFRSSTGCFSLTEQVVEDWRKKTNVFDNATQFESVPSYSENTMAAVGDRILNYMIMQRHEVVKNEREQLDRDLVRYLIAALMTKARKIEAELKPMTLRTRHLDALLEEALVDPYGGILSHYPCLLPAVKIVAAEKFISWWEKETVNIADIQRHEHTLAVEFGLAVTEDDINRIDKIQGKLFKFIDKCVPRVRDSGTSFLLNRDLSVSTHQFHLYANILRYRIGFQRDDTLQTLLAMEILEKSFTEIAELRTRYNFVGIVKMAMDDIVETMQTRDTTDSPSDFIPEFPRPGALALMLRIVVDFVFLSITEEKLKTIENTLEKVIEACDKFRTRSEDITLRQFERDQDILDMQFILDTTISILTTKQMLIDHHLQYKTIVKEASELFPCESKYMKLFTDVNCGSIAKSIYLEKTLKERRQALLTRRLESFDPTLERQLLLISLSSMLITLKITSKRDKKTSGKMLFDKFTQEALLLHDPTIWRLVLKAANGTKVLKDDAYPRAQAQCVWAVNIHIDYVEGMGRPEESIDPGAVPVVATMLMLLTIGGEKSMTVLDDDQVLSTLWQAANQ